MSSPRHQARLDAAAALLGLGWEPERIALALTISRATVERLMPKRELATPLLKAAAVRQAPGDGCCRIIADPRLGTSRYCDAPVKGGGAVYCARHYRDPVVWAS